MAADCNSVSKWQKVLLSCATVFGLIAAPVLSGPAFAQTPGLASMKLDGNQPISIDADRLEVLEKESKAVFTGAVNVVQGATSLQTGKLIVFYAKSDGGSAATGSAAIERMEMSGKIIIKSEKQTATGDAGSFDMKSNVFSLTGDRVVLSEGGNVAVGCKLLVQMATGKANLESCKKNGRVQIMILPNSVQGN
ncbi:MAG: LptA/OstA family protein [Notoacmeibacter sp.]